MKKINISKLFIHVILILGAVAMVGPFLWMIITSLKTLSESTEVPPTLFPSVINWENYVDIFKIFPFFKFYLNTLLVTVGITGGQIIMCSMAAYAFARIKFPGNKMLFIVFLSVLMVPGQAFLIPQYLIVSGLGWLNTIKALILPGVFSAFGTFLLRQFFLTFPDEIEEAAKLDGCNHFQIYWRIMLPLAKPGLIALSIFTIRYAWNDFLWPLITINSLDKMPISAGLATMQGEHTTNYPVLMAGTLLATWPLIVVFVLLQRHFVEGIALSGRKG